MCYIIITCRSMLWTLLSITSFMMILSSVTSPHWLIGYSRQHAVSSIHLQDLKNDTANSPQPSSTDTGSLPLSATRERSGSREGSSVSTTTTMTSYLPQNQETPSGPPEADSEEKETYNPTLGIFNRCHKLHQFQIIPKRENCATFVNDFLLPDAQFPDAWKAAMVFFGLAGVLLLVTCFAAVLSMCVRSVCGKSIFTLSGLVQSVAGLFCILGLVIYPAGWGSEKVKRYCGQFSGPFDMDNCYLGWSFFLCVVGTLLCFLCALLSIKADAATSSHKVEEEVLEGKNLICVM